jgi:hypothetical protein
LGYLEGGETGPQRELVAGGGHGAGGIVAKSQSGGGLGGHESAGVVDGDDGVEWGDVVVGHDDLGCPSGIVERDFEGPGAHEALQGVGLFGGDHHVDAQGSGGVEEVPSPIRRRRDDEE